MHRKVILVSAMVSIVGALVISGCGSSESSNREGAAVAGDTLTVYSSLPLEGSTRQLAQDIVDAEKLALKQAGSKAGAFNIAYVSLNDATQAAGQWEPGQVSANTRKAAQDDTTIAYIGEFNSGASAVATPILNEAGILVVSPASTLVGLTVGGAGAARGEPDKYYPSGKRNFARVIPNDRLQSAALVSSLKDRKLSKVLIVSDGSQYATSLASQVAVGAKNAKLTVIGEERLQVDHANHQTLLMKLASSKADAVFLVANDPVAAADFVKSAVAADKQLQVLVPDSLANDGFAKVVGGAENNLTLVSPSLPARNYPVAGQQFYADFQKETGRAATQYAIFGYTAMQAVLASISTAGKKGNNRQSVIDQFFKIKDYKSPLGIFSINSNGDTSLKQYGVYKAQNGHLVLDHLFTGK